MRRYGLDDRELATLGEELGISRERTRQLQREDERFLKAADRKKILRDAVA